MELIYRVCLLALIDYVKAAPGEDYTGSKFVCRDFLSGSYKLSIVEFKIFFIYPKKQEI